MKIIIPLVKRETCSIESHFTFMASIVQGCSFSCKSLNYWLFRDVKVERRHAYLIAAIQKGPEIVCLTIVEGENNLMSVWLLGHTLDFCVLYFSLFSKNKSTVCRKLYICDFHEVVELILEQMQPLGYKTRVPNANSGTQESLNERNGTQ